VVGCSDGAVRFYGPESGQLRRVLEGAHQTAVHALALSADGGRMYSGDASGFFKTWQLGAQSHTMLAALKEHKVTLTAGKQEHMSHCVSCKYLKPQEAGDGFPALTHGYTDLSRTMLMLQAAHQQLLCTNPAQRRSMAMAPSAILKCSTMSAGANTPHSAGAERQGGSHSLQRRLLHPVGPAHLQAQVHPGSRQQYCGRLLQHRPEPAHHSRQAVQAILQWRTSK
jgi:hypothetical protein